MQIYICHYTPMYLRPYVCIHKRICIVTYIFAFLCIFIYVCMYIGVSIPDCSYWHVIPFRNNHIHIYVYMHTYRHACVYIGI